MTTETAPVATGLLKQVRIAGETTWGTSAAQNAADAHLLRRVSSDISLGKATYRSNEIQPDRQVHDFRHGVRNVSGTLRGELSPLTYEAVFAQLLAGTWTAGVNTGAINVDATAAVAGSPGTAATIVWNAADGTHNFQYIGIRKGDVITCSGFSGGAIANNARNLRVTGFSTTSFANDTIQVGPAPSNTSTIENVASPNEVLVAASHATTGANVTVTVVGKKLVIPQAGSFVDASFTIEQWFTDVLQSEVFTGCRASRANIGLPPTGLGTIDLDIMGKDKLVNPAGAGTPWFTTPAAVSTSGITASVNGLLRANGTDYQIVTGCSFSINPNYTTEAVVGANTTPYLFPNIMDITGQLSVLFADQNFDSAFLNESEIDLQVYLTLDSTKGSNFLSFYFPRIKLTSGRKDDKPGSIIGTYGFQALQNVNAIGNTSTLTDASTIVIQDSLAT